ILVPGEVRRPHGRYIRHTRTHRRTRPGPTLQGVAAQPPSPSEGTGMSWIRRNLLAWSAAAVLPWVVGCYFSPFAFLLVPTQPWVATRMDEKYNNQNDHRTPILPPVRDGF